MNWSVFFSLFLLAVQVGCGGEKTKEMRGSYTASSVAGDRSPEDLYQEGEEKLKGPTVSVPDGSKEGRELFLLSMEGGAGKFRYKFGSADFSDQVITTESHKISLSDLTPDGAHKVFIQELMLDGTWSEIVAQEVIVDTVPPATPLLEKPKLLSNSELLWNWKSGGGDGVGKYKIAWSLTAKESDHIYLDTTTFTSKPPLNQGAYLIIYLYERDRYENWSKPATLKLLLDNDAPEIVQLKGQKQTNNTQPVWTWDIATREPTITYEINLQSGDDEAQVMNISDRHFRPQAPLKDGIYQFEVVAIDEYSNRSDSRQFKTEVRTTFNGEAPSFTNLAVSSKQRPTWKWTSENGSNQFRYFFSQSSNNLLTSTSDTSFVPPANLEDGIYSLKVQEKDNFGNWSPFRMSEIEVDTTPPSNLTISSEQYTQARRPSFSWTSTTPGPLKYRFKLGSAPDENSMASATNSWTVDADLSPGVHRFYIQVADELGNWSRVFTKDTEIDVTPPRPPAVNILTETNEKRPSWSWVESDGGKELDRFDVKLFRNQTLLVSSQQKTRVFQPSVDLTEGNHVLEVAQYDRAGNLSMSASITTQVDFSGPLAPVVSGPDITNAQRPTWTWQAQETSGGAGIFQYRFSNSVTWATTTATQFTPDIDLPAGEHSLQVRERDDAGNWSDHGSFDIEIDRTAESPPIISGDALTNNPRPKLTWISGGGTQVFRYLLDSTAFNANTPTTTQKDFTPAANLPDGVHILRVEEQDNAGNWSQAQFTLTIDTSQPGAPIYTGSHLFNVAKPRLNFQKGNGAISELKLKLNDADQPSGETLVDSYSFILPFSLSEGENELSVSARDAANNWSEPVIVKLRLDTIPPPVPVITDHDLVGTARPTWSWNGSASGDAVKYKVSLYDHQNNRANTITTVEQSYTANIHLTDRTHTIYVTAMDEAGNWSATAEDHFTVDTAPPSRPTFFSAGLTNSNALTWKWRSHTNSNRGVGVFKIRLNDTNFDLEAETTEVQKTINVEKEGNYTLNIIERDQAYNWSDTQSQTITFDATPPKQPIVSGHSPSSIAPTWIWSADNQDTASFMIKVNNRTPDLFKSPYLLQTFTYLGGNEGENEISVFAVDAAGNLSEPGKHTIVFDMTGPTPPSANILNIYDTTKPKIPIESTDPTGSGLFAFSFDKTITPLFKGNETNATSIEPNSPLSDGPHQLHLRERDEAGNWSRTSEIYNFKIDTIPPPAPVIQSKFTHTRKSQPNISWSTLGEVVDQYRFSFNSDISKGQTTENKQARPNEELPIGKNFFWLQSKDLAGNWSRATKFEFTVDQTPPDIPVDFKFEEQSGKVVLSWKGVDTAKGYVLARSEAGDKDFTPINGEPAQVGSGDPKVIYSGKSLKHTDVAPKSTHGYTYHLSAYDEAYNFSAATPLAAKTAEPLAVAMYHGGFYTSMDRPTDIHLSGSTLYSVSPNVGISAVELDALGQTKNVFQMMESGTSLKGIPLNDVQRLNFRAVLAEGRHLFLSNLLKPELVIYEQGSDNQPVLVSKLSFPDQSSPFAKPVLSDSKLYLPFPKFGLKVVDVSNMSAPKEVSSISVPSGLDYLALHGGNLFAADGLRNVQIINISGPGEPVIESTYSTYNGTLNRNGRAVFDFFGTLMVVGTDDETRGLQVVDISDASNPLRSSLIDTPVSTQAIKISNDYLFLVDQSKSQLFRIKQTAPYLVHLADSESKSSSYNVDLVGEYPFSLQSDPNRGIWHYNWSDLEKIETKKIAPSFTYFNAAAFKGGYLFAANRRNGIQLYNVSNTKMITAETILLPSGYVEGLAVSGNMLHSMGSSHTVYDISSPSKPIKLKDAHLGMLDFAICDTNLVVLTDSAHYQANKVEYFNANTGLKLNIGTKLSDSTTKIACLNQYAFVASKEEGIITVDLSDIKNPVVNHTEPAPWQGDVRDVDVINGRLYAQAVDQQGNSRVAVYEIGNNASLTLNAHLEIEVGNDEIKKSNAPNQYLLTLSSSKIKVMNHLGEAIETLEFSSKVRDVVPCGDYSCVLQSLGISMIKAFEY